MKSWVTSSVIQKSSLHVNKPTSSHIYGWPCLPMYCLWGYVYLFKYDWFGAPEFANFWLILAVSLHVLAWLVGKWSVGLNAALNCVQVNDPELADVILIIPIAHNGAGGLCPIVKGESAIHFMFQKEKYLYDAKAKTFVQLDYPDSNTFADYQSCSGLSQKGIELALYKYGKNTFEVPIPTFMELFKEHVVAPFFVFQIFCVALWFLDDMWYYSLFTLVMLFVFESTVVFQRLRTLQEFRSMANKPHLIQVYRDSKWTEIHSDELLPGDLCSIIRHKEEDPIPADFLLLSGSCIVNEAMLSGESTPQLKEPITLREPLETLNFDDDKSNILFAGTKVLQVTKPESGLSTPDGGCLGISLRTGFATQQGKLVRTIIYSNERVTANNLESLLFIVFLLIFAIAASWYVWTEGSKIEGRDQSKLLLHCILIITSVVPPELPMELSLAVNNSLISLSRSFVFCTEPFRIPFAGRLDVACFDKTGTLTAENLIVEGVTGIRASDSLDTLVKTQDVPSTTLHVLAAAHALVMLDDGIIGDPMEKNTLESVKWVLSKGDVVKPKSGKGVSISIVRRFQFSSALKRMSTLSHLEGDGHSRVLVATKGAPETIQTMLSSVPAGYEEHYKFWARKGKRVLALAYKHLPSLKSQQIRELHRAEVESDLTFAGFLVFYCPLKPDSLEAMQALNESSHRVVMITGDNALTACHIAGEVEIVKRPVLIGDVEGSDSSFSWRSIDDIVKFTPDLNSIGLDERLEGYDLCLTGTGLSSIVDRPCFVNLLPRIWVYARVSPSQKELVLMRLKEAGYYTLMCGDGTNDVGALKQAHVGIALLDSSPEDLAKMAAAMMAKRKKEILRRQEELRQKWNLPPDPNAPSNAVTQKGEKSEKGKAKSLMEQMAEQMDDEDDVPRIKFGDASVAAPFTSKVSSVMSVVDIVRQGRATLVATIQMYKILALNSLIMAYSLSVLHLEGIKQGDWQATIAGMLITACFFGIAQTKATPKLSKQRPQPNIFNPYIILTVLGQSLIHVISLIYIRSQALSYSEEMHEILPIDSEFKPNLLNSAVYLVSLIMQISTFAINYQGLPFRESMFQNKALFNSIAIVSGIAFAAAAEISDELNDWMQLVAFPDNFRYKLLFTMIFDFGGAWVIEMTTLYLFSNHAAKKSLFPRVLKKKSV